MLHGRLRRVSARPLRRAGAALSLLATGCAQPAPAPTPASARADDCLTGLRFAEATLHAGATDYRFDSPAEVAVTFRIENGVGESAGFGRFLAPADDGPAETDPALVGRAYRVCFSRGRIIAAPD